MQHAVTFAADEIVTGLIYTLRFKALNSKGYSEYSELLSVAAIDPPAKASTPVHDFSLSTRTSIYVSWQLNPEDSVTGYLLFMDDGIGGDLEVVYDTVGYNEHINSFIATNLTASHQYKFRLQAYNYNTLAPGELSDILWVIACGAPGSLSKPV
jgi:hypothetical protein